MKTIIILLIILSIFSFAILANEKGIITRAKPLNKNSVSQSVELTTSEILAKEQTDKTVTVSANSPDKIKTAAPSNLIEKKVSLTFDGVMDSADEISFSVDELSSDAIPMVVSSSTDSKVEGTVQFPSEGIFNIFYTLAAESTTRMQKVQQVVYAIKLEGTIISKVTGTGVKANKAANIDIEFLSKNLYFGDKVIFSLSTNNTPASGDPNIQLAKEDFSQTKKTASVTFSKEGEYFVWLQRGDAIPVKQTNAAAKIDVAKADTSTETPETPETPSDDDKEDSSNWLSMSFIILTGLLLL